MKLYTCDFVFDSAFCMSSVYKFLFGVAREFISYLFFGINFNVYKWLQIATLESGDPAIRIQIIYGIVHV
jgi:hypothetical protein